MGYPGDHSGDTDGPANGRSLTEPFATGQRYCIEFECFSGDEIEQHLAKLLSARTRGTDSVRRILNTFEAIFGSKLSSDKDRSFLLRGREEDVLDLLLTWIREKPIAPGLRREAFEHLSECLEHLGNLPAAPFTKKVLLSVKTRHGSLFTAQLSARELNGAAEWELDAVRDGIREMAEVDIA
ncbi:hypothetical protein C8A00DRAFT_18167 [Chaetomidium leptoderma]|uniref:Uncharacterized protein n=1 Tax=Chaetomidium leptoderma TaxID=669021 RepID=A0AAN6VGA9_9PEZI|nr:hypothetical protein C8A00DRAFT_18167 [Chaetomidium leptoderma]